MPAMTMQSKAKEKEKKQHEDVGKNHKNKSLMGPFKSLEAPGKYPLFPPTLSVGLLAVQNSWAVYQLPVDFSCGHGSHVH